MAKKRKTSALSALIDDVRWYATQAEAHDTPERRGPFVTLGVVLTDLVASWRAAADEAEADARWRAVDLARTRQGERDVRQLAKATKAWQKAARNWTQLVMRVATGEAVVRVEAAQSALRLGTPSGRGGEEELRRALPRLEAVGELLALLDGTGLVERARALLAGFDALREQEVGVVSDKRARPTGRASRLRLEALLTEAERLWALAATVGEVVPLVSRRPAAVPMRREETSGVGDLTLVVGEPTSGVGGFTSEVGGSPSVSGEVASSLGEPTSGVGTSSSGVDGLPSGGCEGETGAGRRTTAL